MKGRFTAIAGACLLQLAGLTLSAAPASAEDIAVTAYGLATGGYPYAVALEKGFFKEAGADVTDILTSPGGGTTIRNVIGGNLGYGEASISAVVLAIRAGAQIKIIAGNNNSVASVVFATRPDSSINSIKDLKGKKIGYTIPGSTTHLLAVMLGEAAGLKQGEFEVVKTGGLGEAVVALSQGIIDVAPFYEPVWTDKKSQYKLLARASDVLPAITDNIGITTIATIKNRPDFIRAVIAARRKAIEFMRTNPKEAADIIASTHKLPPAVALESLTSVLEAEKKSGTEFFGSGAFNYTAMNTVMSMQKRLGAIPDDVKWDEIVDESFLPEDMKTKRK